MRGVTRFRCFKQLCNASRSSTPTLKFFAARDRASRLVTVDLPTPPLPERTRSLCLTPESRSAITATSGSGPFGCAEAQICWFGQPWHASAFPAASLSVPGQCSGTLSLLIVVAAEVEVLQVPA